MAFWRWCISVCLLVIPLEGWAGTFVAPALAIEKEIPSPPPASQKLTLTDALQATLLYQWNVQIGRLQVEAQRGVVETNAGPFDPTLAAAAQRTVTQNNGQVAGATGNENELSLTLTQPTRLGTTLSAEAAIAQANTPSPLALSETNQGTLTFTVQQPLLQGLFYGTNTVTEEASRLTFEALRWTTLQSIATLLAQTTSDYWSAVGARAAWLSQVESENELRLLAENTQALIDAHQIAAADIQQPMAQLSSAILSRIAAEQSLIAAIRTVYFDMGITDVPPGFDYFSVTLDDFPAVPPLNTTDSVALQNYTSTLFQRIHDRRPDIVGSEYTIESAEISLKGAHNLMLPTLNVVGQVVAQNTTAPPQNPQPILSGLNMNNTPQAAWTVGLTLSIPLFNWAGKGDVITAKSNKFQAKINSQELLQKAISDTTVTVNNYYHLLGEIKNAEDAVTRFQTLYENENEKIKLGLTTMFELVQYQQQLITAQLSRISTLQSFYQNLAQMRLVSGWLLDVHLKDDLIAVEDLTIPPLLNPPSALQESREKRLLVAEPLIPSPFK